MPFVQLKARYGTWYRSDEPAVVKYNKTSYIALRASGPVMHSYVYFSNPFNIPGAKVTSAKLYLYMQSGTTNTGTRSVSVQRVGKGLQFTTMNYNNRPTVFAGSTSSKSTTGPLGANHQFEIDITADMQDVANGGSFYGYIITTTAPFTIQLHGTNTSFPPAMFVQYSYPPTPPRDLSPALGRAVGVAKPYLGFSYYDVAGEEKITALQVQTAASSSGFGSPAWDSGQVVTSTTGLDLAATSFPAPVANASVWWRVRARSSAGIWSDYSTPTPWVYKPHGTVTVTAPTGTVSDPTPPITWTSTGTASQWRVGWYEEKTSGTRMLLDGSGLQTTPPGSWTPSKGPSRPGTRCIAVVDVFDDAHREATPGDRGYASGQSVVTFTPSATVAPVTGFAVTSSYPRPEVALAWTRTELADSWNIYRDGTLLESVPGTSTRIGSTANHRYVTRTPSGPHSWYVRAVVNGKVSAATAITVDSGHLGSWLFDDEGRSVCIQDDRDHQMGYAEVSAVHEPLGSDRVVVTTQAMRGLEGTLEGLLAPLKGQTETPEQWRENLLAFKSPPGRTFELLIEDQVIPVVLRAVKIKRDPRPRMWQVSFEFYQQGGLPFDATMGG